MRRSQMVEQERKCRSRLKLLIGYRELLRGTLTIREHTCGKSNCRCVNGRKHKSLYISRSENGRVEQLYIPKDKEEIAREWVKQYHIIQELVEKISLIYWKRLKKGV